MILWKLDSADCLALRKTYQFAQSLRTIDNLISKRKNIKLKTKAQDLID